MNRIALLSLFRSAAATLIVAGCTSAVYAACCKYNLAWETPQGSTGPCQGSKIKFCENSSSSCTAPTPPAASNYSCLINRGDTRKAECREITMHAWGQLLHGACDSHPGGGWQLIGILPDGSCCWAFGVLSTNSDTAPSGILVNRCIDTCIAEQ